MSPSIADLGVPMTTPGSSWINTDFNGFLEPGLLRLAHSETVRDQSGREVKLSEGIVSAHRTLGRASRTPAL
jgi:hypothetical protein